MGRKTSKGLLDALTRVHWSVGVITGVMMFLFIRFGMLFAFLFVFGRMSTTPPPITDKLESVLTMMGLLAMLACWAAAFMSVVLAKKRKRLLDSQTGIESIRQLSWQQFEQLVAEAYRRRGYKVQENGGGGKDGGIDLLLKKKGKTFMVQCKQWRTARVSAPVAREMWGLVAHHKFDGVKIVCIGKFTPDASQFAQGKAMELVSGQALVDLIASVRTGPAHSPVSEHDTPKLKWAPGTLPNKSSNVASLHNLCPKCRSKMVLRTSRSSSEDFWGCRQYPACKGTKPL